MHVSRDHIRYLVETAAAELGPTASLPEIERRVRRQLETRRFPTVRLDVVLQISLDDCASPLIPSLRARSYDRIRRLAAHLSAAIRRGVRDASCSTEVTAGRIEVETSPVAGLLGSALPFDYVSLATAFEAAAVQCGLNRLSALSGADPAFLRALPAVLGVASHQEVCVHVDPAAPPERLVELAAVVERLSGGRRIIFRRRREECRTELDVRVDCTGLVTECFDAALSPADVCDVIEKTAAAWTSAVTEIGVRVGGIVSHRSGIEVPFGRLLVDLPYGVTEDVGGEAARRMLLFAAVGGAGAVACPPHRALALSSSTPGEARVAALAERLRRLEGDVLHCAISDRPPGAEVIVDERAPSTAVVRPVFRGRVSGINLPSG